MATVKRALLCLMLCLLVLPYGGCGGLSGPLFQRVDDFPQEQSMMYIYRAEGEGGTEFVISCNDMKICVLKSGGYFPFAVEPGKVVVTSMVQFNFGASGLLDVAMADTTELVFEAKAGQSYFVEGLTEDARSQELFIRLAPEKYGSNRIKTCKLLKPDL